MTMYYMKTILDYLESKQSVSYIFAQDLKYLLEIRNNKNWQLIRKLQILNFETKFDLDFCDQVIHGIVNTKANYSLKIKCICDDIDFTIAELENISLILRAKDEIKEYTCFIDDPKIMCINYYKHKAWTIGELDFVFYENMHNSWKFI